VLAVTSIKQPTCLKQPNKMFPDVEFVLKFTSFKQPPALSSHFLCFPWWQLNTGLTVQILKVISILPLQVPGAPLPDQ